MADTRGVFSLSRVFTRARKGTWVSTADAYTQQAPTPIGYDTGYFGGGRISPNNFSTMNKVTYSDDTTAAVSGAALSGVRYLFAATSSTTAGYFGGGIPGPVSTVDKTTYSDDTTAAVPGAALSAPRYGSSGTGNSGAGYFSGGVAQPNFYSTTDKVTYSTDTSAVVPGAALSAVRTYMRATGNSTAAYFGGGGNTNPVPSNTLTIVDKLTYSTETIARIPSGDLNVGRNRHGATGNSGAGYFGGGSTGGSFVSTVEKCTYSTETCAVVSGAALSSVRFGVAASSSSTAGYFGGGRNSPNDFSTMDKLTYSSDTTAEVPGAALSGARYSPAATSSRDDALPTTQAAPIINLEGQVSGPNIGYRFGGESPRKSFTDKVNYTTDTTSRVPGGSDVVERRHQGTSNTTTRGYVFGGDTPGSPTQISTASRMTYSSETMAQIPGAALTTTRTNPVGKGNNNQGYMSGGRNPNTSSTDKCTYSTETTARVPGADISSPRWGAAAVGNQELQYILGGRNPAISPSPNSYGSMIQKMSFSSETMSTISDTLSAARYLTSGTSSNKNAGYLCGGYTPGGPLVTTTDRITFSTDAVTAVPSAALTGVRYGSAGAGNNSAGYIMGGNVSFPNHTSYVDKLDYATETTSASSNLPENIQYSAATSSRDNALPFQAATTTTNAFSDASTAPNTGYVGGGYDGSSAYSVIDKTNYSTDTTARVPGANLSATRYIGAATGNTTTGYFGGGQNPPSFAPYSTMDKLTYSSDTTAAVPGADLSVARSSPDATSSATAGYFGGGTPGPRSEMDKLTYSSDTTAVVPGANLTANRRSTGAAGNQAAGYFGGGRESNPVSTMDKVTYSTDTTATIPGAALSVARYYVSATGNQAAGYFGGGTNPSVPANYTTMDKLTYSTETTAQSPGVSLSVARYYAGATGNSAAGYFGGGLSPAVPARYSTMDKLDYSTDTSAVTPTAALTDNFGFVSATGARDDAVAATTNVV